MINLSDIETIAKTVKISISKESLLEFSENLQKKIDLAMEIDEIDTSHIDANTIFFNFFYQSLDLLEEPIEEISPKFYRPHKNNMIIVPKFVDKN